MPLPRREWFWTGILMVTLSLAFGLYALLSKEFFIFYLDLGRSGLSAACNRRKHCVAFGTLDACYTSSPCIDPAATPISVTDTCEILILVKEHCSVWDEGNCSWSLSFSLQQGSHNAVAFRLQMPAYGAEVWGDSEHHVDYRVTCQSAGPDGWQVRTNAGNPSPTGGQSFA